MRGSEVKIRSNNRIVIELINREFLYPQDAGEKALEGGLLAFLPENAQIMYQISDGRTIRLDTRDGWQVRRSADGILYQLPEKDEIIFETLDFYGF